MAIFGFRYAISRDPESCRPQSGSWSLSRADLGSIDDDEIARPGWIDALVRHAELGLPASFGMVVPRYLGPVEPGLRGLLDDLYTRDLKRPADVDISASWIHVGTGNSLFDKAQCFVTSAPFAAELNGTGARTAGSSQSVEWGVALTGIRPQWWKSR